MLLKGGQGENAVTNNRWGFAGFGRAVLFVGPVALLVACGSSNEQLDNHGGGGSGASTAGTSGGGASAGITESGGAPAMAGSGAALSGKGGAGTAGSAAAETAGAAGQERAGSGGAETAVAGAENAGSGGALAGSGGTANAGSGGALAGSGGTANAGSGGAMNGGSAGISGSAGIGGSAGVGGGAGGASTTFPPFSTPTTITTVSEQPHHGCQENEVSNVIIAPTDVSSDGVWSVQPGLLACQPAQVGLTPYDWSLLATKRSVPTVKHTWVGFLTVAVAGKYTDTVAAELLEGEQNFMSATCFSGSKGSATAAVYGPEPEQVICGGFNTDLFGGWGTFRAHLVPGAPGIAFYPKDGSAPVPLTIIDL
jgi:hypothetical protein